MLSRALRRAFVYAVTLPLVAGCVSVDRSAEAPSPSAVPADDPAVVQTDAGAVRGTVTDRYRFFGGIPYAAAPVDDLRWRPPEPVPEWSEVRESSRPGPRCIQNPAGDPEAGGNSDEDCLTLNVWTPPPGDDELRPVLVWIHGGGFVNGDGGMFDSEWFVDRGDIIVVTINYRLGTLGFLAHPALGPPGAVGNYGFADQQAALRWVSDNILEFGGDPDQVAIAGESAGGMAVCDHLVAPGSAGLFRAAIIMSAPCQGQVDVDTAEQVSLRYAAELGCDDPADAAACLRALPPEALAEPVTYFGFGTEKLSGPVVGTDVLPVDPVTAIADGRAARVPVLIGTNRDEFTLFAGLRYLREGQRFTAENHPRLLAEIFGDDAAAVAERYPPQHHDSAALAYTTAVTDGLFACLSERMADHLARNQPVYSYEFNDRDAPAPPPLRTLPFPVGASHSLELRYLFDIGGAPALTAAQRALSDQMVDYWSAFVATGSPAVGGQPDWPEHRAPDEAPDEAPGAAPADRAPPSGPRMTLQPGDSRAVDDFATAHHCAFWAGLAG
ncbi:carboxylesterase/lipase family protein [Mycolicibacterium thermoresistibile]